MQFVRQVYAGWVGIEDEDKVVNGVVTFQLDNSRRKQLVPHVPNTSELKQLEARLLDEPVSPHKYLEYVRRFI